nr:NADH dehydrogenase subunit 3 [Fenusa (Kaliofenusa) sp. 1 GYN-2022b]
MNIIMNSMIMIMSLTTFIMLMALMLSKKKLYDREKTTPFECGFDPKENSRLPFSLRFFLITVIFLIFDVEITLMLPMILIMSTSNFKIWLMVSLYFNFILLVGIYYEWKLGALNWLN